MPHQNRENPTQREAFYALILKILIIFGILIGLYYGWFLESRHHAAFIGFLVNKSSLILSLIGFEHNAYFDSGISYAQIKTEVGGGIVNGGLVVIDQGSDAMIETTLLLAIILAWNAKILPKLLFALGGIILLIALNLLRISAMVLVDHYWPLYFPLTKDWVFPGIMVFAAIGYFYTFVIVSSKPHNT